MEKVIHSDYLTEEQVLELREGLLSATKADVIFELVEKLDRFIQQNGTADEKYNKLVNCLAATKPVVMDEELNKIRCLLLVGPFYGVTVMALLILTGVFDEEDAELAFLEQTFPANKSNRSA